jgi:hypothetical protein
MNYKQAYLGLITEQNLPALKLKMAALKMYSASIIEGIEIKNNGHINYLTCPITLYKGMEKVPGLLQSIAVDLGDLVPDWEGLFYLPTLFMAKREDYLFDKYMPYQIVLAHELLHLKQIIKKITADPQLIFRANNYCLSGTHSSTLRHGLRYEIEKIFTMELEAHVQDWDLGMRFVLHEDGVGGMKAVQYFNKDTFVKHNIALYIMEIMMAFQKKFPNRKHEIKKIVQPLLAELGASLFGTKAFDNFGSTAMAAYNYFENPGNVQSAVVF